MMARDERRFKLANKDGDYEANKEEFTAFIHPEEFEHMKDIVVIVSDKIGAVGNTTVTAVYLSCSALFSSL